MAVLSPTLAAAPITVAYGDGIGPEIMAATLHVLEAAGALLAPDAIEIGESAVRAGHPGGFEPSAWEALRRTRVFLKAPVTTPEIRGFQSLAVTTRKTFGLFASVRPCISYHPFVRTKFPNMDLVIIRENEEGLSAGIEYRLSTDVRECLKLITRPGAEKVIRYTFDYARRHNRRKVTCLTKDNVMKMTDGLFHRVFDEISADYPEIGTEHWIVDIGAAKLATAPEEFDVIVTPYIYGDILSDVAAQLSGSVGLAGSANIGDYGAMFEAVHGSAPRHAGRNEANPSGLLLAAVMMLVHMGQTEAAERVHNAWLRTIEDGIHTYDIYSEDVSRQRVGTKEFAQAVVARLGCLPRKLRPVCYVVTEPSYLDDIGGVSRPFPEAALVGMDVYVEWQDRTPEDLAARMLRANGDGMKLNLISNRGVKVWPQGQPETFCADCFCCRFLSELPHPGLTPRKMVALLERVVDQGLIIVKTESLRTFDGQLGYSLAQGEQ